jgi:hypothetical protein
LTTRKSNPIPSLFAFSFKMASYSTNPYNNFQAANSKEYISLDKGAKQDFRPETRFDIIPGNSDLFSAEIKKCATQFGYGALLNVTTDHNFSQNLPSTEIQPPIQVGFSISDATGISQNGDYIQRPLLPPVSSCNGEMTLSQDQDSLSAPRLINLETSGLRRSSRIASLNGVTQDDPAIAAYTSSTPQLKSRQTTRPKPKLSFLSVFNSVGA